MPHPRSMRETQFCGEHVSLICYYNYWLLKLCCVCVCVCVCIIFSIYMNQNSACIKNERQNSGYRKQQIFSNLVMSSLHTIAQLDKYQKRLNIFKLQCVFNLKHYMLPSLPKSMVILSHLYKFFYKEIKNYIK